MIYVFDTSSLSVIFKHYYRDRFPTFWDCFEPAIGEGAIISVKEVKREINESVPRLFEWSKEHKEFFAEPTQEEFVFLTKIFKVRHFQTLIKKRERLMGKPVADPFVIAKASIYGKEGCVVTEEANLKNAARIPNVCDHFSIECINLETFMEKQNWSF